MIILLLDPDSGPILRRNEDSGSGGGFGGGASGRPRNVFASYPEVPLKLLGYVPR